VSGWRCFVAIPLGDELRAELAVAVERWRDRPDCAGLRWTDPDAWHLTLAFIGDVEPMRVEALSSAISAVTEPHAAVTMATGGVGAFPRPARATVAWYGIADPYGALAGLADVVRRSLRLPVEPQPFRPHVTLARTRGGGHADLRAWVREADPPVGRLEVGAVHLMRSHLGSGPARYEALSTIRLRGAVHA
jgi:RNA 2',3'-cyclic 3'-phosphodiesterase